VTATCRPTEAFAPPGEGYPARAVDRTQKLREVQPHIHAVLGREDGTTRGGHLLEEHVWPTLEVIIRETRAGLRKTRRPEIGLALIDLDQ
jgi:predicted DNA-binding protein with PD1-like motif